MAGVAQSSASQRSDERAKLALGFEQELKRAGAQLLSQKSLAGLLDSHTFSLLTKIDQDCEDAFDRVLTYRLIDVARILGGTYAPRSKYLALIKLVRAYEAQDSISADIADLVLDSQCESNKRGRPSSG